MDDVPVVDGVAALVLRHRLTASHRCDRRGAEGAFEPVIKDAHTQAMANQPRWHGVKYQDEAARGRHRDHLLLEVGCMALREVPERGTLQIDIGPFSWAMPALLREGS